MSFMGQATATALPAEVQLAKEKPQGAFCLRSRYALSANSANSWLAGSLVSLPLQTGTPGTFTDVKQGNINCTLQIFNSNPYVDFMNFGPCGAIIFFDEMRVYSSGTPVEENLRYSETVDLLMEQGGWQCRPLHVFRRNKWRAANGRAGDKHINFVKPSMVDVYGCPMFGRTPLMDKNSAVYQPPAIAFGVQNSTGKVDNTGTPSVTLANAFNNLALLAVSKADTTPTNAFFGSILGSDTGYTFNDDGIAAASSRVAAGEYLSTNSGKGFNTNLIAGRVPSVISANASGQYKADPSAWKNTQVGRVPADVGYVSSTAGVTFPWTPVTSFVPSQWPDYQPCTLCGDTDDFEIDQIIGKTKIAEYMKYLANVRSIPIGLKGNNANGYTSNCDPLAVSTTPGVNANNSRFVEYRVSMPFISGIYGILADKMFPDLLIGANNIRIEFKLAQNQKALWLTMDPCRRIPGTIRDWVPFTGEVNGGGRGAGILVNKPFCSVGAEGTAADRNLVALGCFYSRVCYYDSSADSNYGGQTKYTDSTPTAQTAAAATLFAIIRDSNMYNTSSALGEDLISAQIAVDQTTGCPQANGVTAGGHYATYSYLPKPQYIPCPTPWTKKSYFVSGTNVTASHCNENAACFGTYLPASVPQTRRCQPSSRLAISDSVFGSAGTTAFAIRDIQYIGEQVQLDDISASAIIQQAATSEIVVWTRGYRSFEANATVGSEQNIILPIQIGQATALYTIFRPGVQLLNFDYYSNSFVCPFVGLSFDGSKTGADASQSGIYYGRQGRQADVGGVYTINSTLDTQNQGLFSYQLFSGTRQYPLQPIQTVSDLLVEREKSTHSLHNWSWCGTENMHIMSWDKNFNSSTTTGYLFDPFLDLGFFTTFVPTLALDDQTITQNPYMSIAEVNESGFPKAPIRGVRQTPYQSSIQSQFIGVLNQFVPPIGTFFLGWDFESWTNHDDLMRTGKFLGQEQLTLRMTGCKLMEALNPTSSYGPPLPQPISVSAIVPHVVKLSFVPGGHMLSYY